MEEKKKTEIKLEDRLLKVLAIVTDWLKFAEAKNAMLTAFNGASIYGLAKAMELDFFKASFWSCYATIVIIFLIFSAVVCLLSFVPSLNLVSSRAVLGSSEPNSLFFEHLKNQSEVEIIQLIGETEENSFTSFEMDVANQIKQNSTIASKKYTYFSIAVWITMAAYVTPVLAGLFGIYAFMQKKDVR